jgi:hypothetical protein
MLDDTSTAARAALDSLRSTAIVSVSRPIERRMP